MLFYLYIFFKFTSSFEFNVKLLKTIIDELYACRFGTFLYNNEKERYDLVCYFNFTASQYLTIVLIIGS